MLAHPSDDAMADEVAFRDRLWTLRLRSTLLRLESRAQRDRFRRLRATGAARRFELERLFHRSRWLQRGIPLPRVTATTGTERECR